MLIASEKTQRTPFLCVLEIKVRFSHLEVACLVSFQSFAFLNVQQRIPKTGGMVVSTSDELFLDLSYSITWILGHIVSRRSYCSLISR